MIFFVMRPEGLHNFPLVDKFVYTGEKLNPWRCELCATKRQIKAAKKVPVTTFDMRPRGIPIPRCCRKCGCDFFR